MDFSTDKVMQTAFIEMNNGQHTEAAKHFDMVVINDPTNIDAPFYRAYCNCFDITLGEMPNAAIKFTNAFYRYVDDIKQLNNPEFERQKLDYAVELLTTLVSMYQSNSKSTMLTAPSVGLSISNAASTMNTNCKNKLLSVGANVSTTMMQRNEQFAKSNGSTNAVLFALVGIGAVLFVASIVWIWAI